MGKRKKNRFDHECALYTGETSPSIYIITAGVPRRYRYKSLSCIFGGEGECTHTRG